MNIFENLPNPAERRWHLLSKALETNSLEEALALAKAAEDFINGAGSAGNGRENTEPSLTRIANERSIAIKEAPTVAEARPVDVQATASTIDAARTASATTNGDISAELVVLATPNDVVRFLQQNGEVVADINGESFPPLDLRELLVRANQIRARQKRLPFFVPTIRGVSAAAGEPTS